MRVVHKIEEYVVRPEVMGGVRDGEIQRRVRVVRRVVVEQALEAELVVRCRGLELQFVKCVDDIACTLEWFTPDERAKCEHFLLGTAILVEDFHLLDDRRLAAERGYPCTQQTPAHNAFYAFARRHC
jgi:hypothetical protein